MGHSALPALPPQWSCRIVVTACNTRPVSCMPHLDRASKHGAHLIYGGSLSHAYAFSYGLCSAARQQPTITPPTATLTSSRLAPPPAAAAAATAKAHAAPIDDGFSFDDEPMTNDAIGSGAPSAAVGAAAAAVDMPRSPSARPSAAAELPRTVGRLGSERTSVFADKVRWLSQFTRTAHARARTQCTRPSAVVRAGKTRRAAS